MSFNKRLFDFRWFQVENGADEKQWYLFNDFSVSHISAEESISFFPDWKLPCLLFYSVREYSYAKDIGEFDELNWSWIEVESAGLLVLFQRLENDRTFVDRPLNPITADVFKEDKSLALKSEVLQRISFLPLAADEMPGRGDLVAMDAEFVTLNQEEAELRSDGKSTTVRPSQMSVARVTVIRGWVIDEDYFCFDGVRLTIKPLARFTRSSSESI